MIWELDDEMQGMCCHVRSAMPYLAIVILAAALPLQVSYRFCGGQPPCQQGRHLGDAPV